MGPAIATEFLKLRRARVTWLSALVLSLGPAAISLFMWIVREPGRAADLGLLGTKAQLAGLEATWPAFFSMLVLVIGAGGLLMLAFIVAYVFGREYADGTAKNMLALPLARSRIVYAKLLVAAVWWSVLVGVVVAEALLAAAALGLPGYSPQLAAAAIGRSFLAAAIAFLLAPPVAWITVLGRGYLAPLGFALAMLALGNVVSRTGWAPFFPWSSVPLLVGMVGKPAPLPAATYVVVALTFLGGIALTIAQLHADNTQ